MENVEKNRLPPNWFPEIDILEVVLFALFSARNCVRLMPPGHLVSTELNLSPTRELVFLVFEKYGYYGYHVEFVSMKKIDLSNTKKTGNWRGFHNFLWETMSINMLNWSAYKDKCWDTWEIMPIC